MKNCNKTLLLVNSNSRDYLQPEFLTQTNVQNLKTIKQDLRFYCRSKISFLSENNYTVISLIRVNILPKMG